LAFLFESLFLWKIVYKTVQLLKFAFLTIDQVFSGWAGMFICRTNYITI